MLACYKKFYIWITTISVFAPLNLDLKYFQLSHCFNIYGTCLIFWSTVLFRVYKIKSKEKNCESAN